MTTASTGAPQATDTRARTRACEVCDSRLCRRGKATTGLCAACRRAAAAFARRWMCDLSAAGHSSSEIGQIVGFDRDTVRARLSDHRRTEQEAVIHAT